MRTKKKKIEKVIEDKLQKALDSGLIEKVMKTESDVDFLDSKLDKLSAELIKEVGHVQMDSTASILNLITESISAKLEKSEIMETLLEEEIDTIVQGAVSQLKEPS